MIEELLAPVVAAVSTRGDVPGAGLYPEEEALVGRAVPERRREFATGRHCARRALGRFGIPAGPILKTEHGAPCWPEGIVGSMTHCPGYRATAVAWRRDVLALGIDAEPDRPLPDGVLEAVTVAGERAALVGHAEARARARANAHVPAHGQGRVSAQVHWDRLLFSAKESVYKAWHPLTGRRLDFTDTALDFDPARGTFTARLLVPPPVLAGHGPLTEFRGRWAARDGIVVTAVVVPAAPDAGVLR
ncbi:4'-phosphopantetheinyl transferase [Streptomyces sp. NPDC099050]|uniref:4'-phosphopantetheinyl transferase family protein n=1 Tax=Streptomyces sp. NPDC099050 TaxID=3366100 RepID=UPI00380EDBAD